ncbi:YoaK family protein [Streptomyces sp. NPDC101151]|uniref:YoaK family protein n=1 Tax=Streptomyces sp. NPDC101151 TaxID=3366115 RepID=UPI00381F69E1
MTGSKAADDVSGHPARVEVRIAVVMFALTVTAASIDAIIFLGLGRAFAAMATGNVLFLGFGLAKAGTPTARPAEALAAFTFGVATAHVVVGRLRRQGRRWLTRSLAVETTTVLVVGLVVVGTSGRRTPPEHITVLAVVLLAAAMGWRNRVMLQAGIPDMPTTVMQTTLVKALVDVMSWRPAAPHDPLLPRARRLATISGVFLGAVAGALLLHLGPGPALLCVAGLSACVTALYSRSPRLRPPDAAQTGGKH